LASALKAAVAARKTPEQSHALPAFVPLYEGKRGSEREREREIYIYKKANGFSN